MAGREAGIVEEAAGPGLGKAEHRNGALHRRDRLPPCAAAIEQRQEFIDRRAGGTMILAIDSVEGQRGRPSADSRFDLLKAVESSPARLASPDADSE